MRKAYEVGDSGNEAKGWPQIHGACETRTRGERVVVRSKAQCPVPRIPLVSPHHDQRHYLGSVVCFLLYGGCAIALTWAHLVNYLRGDIMLRTADKKRANIWNCGRVNYYFCMGGLFF